LFLGFLQTFKQSPDFFSIVGVMPQIFSCDVEDLSFVVENGCSISYGSRVPLGGSIKVYFVETSLRSLPMGRDGLRNGIWGRDRKRGVEVQMPRIEDEMLILWAIQVMIHPVVEVHRFHNVGVDFRPNFFPIPGSKFKYSTILFLPNFPKDEARKELPNYIKDGRLER
jgi:hypothetical protein